MKIDLNELYYEKRFDHFKKKKKKKESDFVSLE